MSKSSNLNVSAIKKVDGKVYKQSASIKNGEISSVEKSIENSDDTANEKKFSAKNNEAEKTASEHPMDMLIESAYVMTSKMPLAGPYVKRTMDGVHFKWMVHEFADVVFKPFFPMPKSKK